MPKKDRPAKRPSAEPKAKHGNPICSPDGKLIATSFALPATVAAPVYPVADRRRILDQLSIALEGFYVHLPRKKAIYGFDPVRALALLRLQVETFSDADFHENLVEITARIRDQHVTFLGRTPYGAFAVLPFNVETYWDAGVEIYLVTSLTVGATPKLLQPGARVTHWNGIPIDRYVRLNANMFDGGNEASSLARSLVCLTSRPLAQFGPPLEEWVDLRFVLNGADMEERFLWEGLDPVDTPTYPAIGRNSTGFGGDLMLMGLQNARRVLIAPQSFDQAAPAAPVAAPTGAPVILGSGAGGTFDYGTVTTGDGTFAYLRFWSFSAGSADELVDALAPILPTLPQNGLVFDIRRNTGGRIVAGERVLQLFGANPIVPARFQFRVTELTRSMANASDEFIRWRPSFSEAFSTGEDYTRGIPIEGEDTDYNKVGRKYAGPVVLVCDALAISTPDMFAAGFIDNQLGKVICTDANMAAAGGNNWSWDAVRIYNPDFRLDARLKPDFTSGKLTAQILDAFNASGASLSKKATLSNGIDDDGDTIWSVQDGSMTHIVRDQPWMSTDLEVYLSRSPEGLTSLPRGIYFGLTMRRALRVKANEGRVLEDTGIVPDIRYYMTLRDVTEKNQDLFERACKELSGAIAA